MWTTVWMGSVRCTGPLRRVRWLPAAYSSKTAPKSPPRINTVGPPSWWASRAGFRTSQTTSWTSTSTSMLEIREEIQDGFNTFYKQRRVSILDLRMANWMEGFDKKKSPNIKMKIIFSELLTCWDWFWVNPATLKQVLVPSDRNPQCSRKRLVPTIAPNEFYETPLACLRSSADFYDCNSCNFAF